MCAVVSSVTVRDARDAPSSGTTCSFLLIAEVRCLRQVNVFDLVTPRFVPLVEGETSEAAGEAAGEGTTLVALSTRTDFAIPGEQNVF
jgi:hypothetical protein